MSALVSQIGFWAGSLIKFGPYIRSKRKSVPESPNLSHVQSSIRKWIHRGRTVLKRRRTVTLTSMSLIKEWLRQPSLVISDIVCLMLFRGANNYNTGLMTAALRGQLDIVLLMLLQGTNDF